MVQQAPQNEAKYHSKNSRELLSQNSQNVQFSRSSPEAFCPNLNGCTCNFTSGTNRLQVRMFISILTQNSLIHNTK